MKRSPLVSPPRQPLTGLFQIPYTTNASGYASGNVVAVGGVDSDDERRIFIQQALTDDIHVNAETGDVHQRGKDRHWFPVDRSDALYGHVKAAVYKFDPAIGDAVLWASS